MAPCSSCGKAVPAQADFCPSCGARTARTPPEGLESNRLEPPIQFSEQDQRQLLQTSVGDAYEIQGRIGRGGFGEVYAAHERALKRKVAIKVLRADLFSTRTARMRFRQEALAVAKVRHPNIIPIYAVGEDDRVAYIVMPLVEGASLAAVLDREGRLSCSEARRILIEAADALHCAHEAGVIHRDIKPQNIMLEGPGRRVLIMDFGLARLANSDWGTLTGSGIVLGTPAYMSPEQASGSADLDARTDIYSLGVVGYRLLTGSLPFEGTSPQELIVSHLIEMPRNPTVRQWDIPTDLAGAVMRCLLKDPTKRWSSARELSLALSRKKDEAPSIPAPVPPRPAVVTPVPKRAPSNIGGYVVLGGGVVVAALTVWLGGPEPFKPTPVSDDLPAVEAPGDSTAQQSIDSGTPTQSAPQDRNLLTPGLRADQEAPPNQVEAPQETLGYLSIDSDPPGQVFVDGVYIGPTPQIRLAMQPGRHRVRVEAPGYKPASFVEQVDAGNMIGKRLTLVPQ